MRAATGILRAAPACADRDAGQPIAAGLPDGTPHPDPFLAGRGWQALGGIYRRVRHEGSAAA
jgi:hypothetical protein